MGDARFYTREGLNYWRVTTIGALAGGFDGTWWAAGMAAECAVRERDVLDMMKTDKARIDYAKAAHKRHTAARGRLGTNLHRHAEKRSLGDPPPGPGPITQGRDALEADDLDEYEALVAVWEDFFATIEPEIESAEGTVYHNGLRYAGTFDSIHRWPRDVLGDRTPRQWIERADKRGAEKLNVLIDYKTGRGIYPEVGLQLNAYERAEFVGMPDGTDQPLPPIDGLAVVHVREDGWEIVAVRSGDDIYRAFVSMFRVLKWQKQVAPTVLGGRRSSRKITPKEEETDEAGE